MFSSWPVMSLHLSRASEVLLPQQKQKHWPECNGICSTKYKGICWGWSISMAVTHSRYFQYVNLVRCEILMLTWSSYYLLSIWRKMFLIIHGVALSCLIMSSYIDFITGYAWKRVICWFLQWHRNFLSPSSPDLSVPIYMIAWYFVDHF